MSYEPSTVDGATVGALGQRVTEQLFRISNAIRTTVRNLATNYYTKSEVDDQIAGNTNAKGWYDQTTDTLISGPFYPGGLPDPALLLEGQYFLLAETGDVAAGVTWDFVSGLTGCKANGKFVTVDSPSKGYIYVEPAPVDEHNVLPGRDEADAHPTSAVTGLDTKQAAQDAATATVGNNLATHAADQTDPHETLRSAWQVQDATRDYDLLPIAVGDTSSPGIGNVDYAINHVAFGVVATEGIEGFVRQRDDNDGGGVEVAGARGSDPANFDYNAPVEIAGAYLQVSTELFIQVPEAKTAEHYLIAGPSVVAGNGRHYSPVYLGPTVIYGQSDSAADTQDVLLVAGDSIGPDTQIVSVTLTADYAADISTFLYSLYLSEEGGRSVTFTPQVWLDGAHYQDLPEVTLNGGTQLLTQSIRLTAPRSTGEVISLYCSATGTHAQSDGWVRGSVSASRVEIRQEGA